MKSPVTTSHSLTGKVGLYFDMLLGFACALILISMMMLTTTDVVARYVFNSPIKGAYELTELLMASLAFLALPLATKSGEHIEVHLLDVSKPLVLRWLSKGIVILSGLMVFGAMAYQLWEHAEKLKRYGQVTNALEIPLFYVGYLAAGCALLCALVLALQALKRL